MDAKTYPLQDILKPERRYIIPTFQRDYEWTREGQWRLLFEDLAATADRLLAVRTGGLEGQQLAAKEQGVPPHFLGAIVCGQMPFSTGGVALRSVIDGQQRLTTIQLLVRGLLDVLSANESDRARSTRRMLFNPEDVVDRDYEKYKLWPRRRDRESWPAVMADQPPSYDPKADHLYLQARQFFSSAAAEYAEIDGEVDRERLAALADALSSLFKLVVIDLDDNDDAQVIFEVLNGRQTPLSAIDLVKNLLFLRGELAEADVESLYTLYWEQFDDPWWKHEVGRGHAARGRRDVLLSTWLTAVTGQEATVGHLYREAREYLGTGPSTEDVLKELSSYAHAYKVIYGAEPAPAPALQLSYERITSLDLTTAVPLLAWILTTSEEALTLDGKVRATRAVESWAIRRLLVGAQSRGYGAHLTRVLREAQQALANGEDIANAIISGLQAGALQWPSDDEVADAFLTRGFYGSVNQARLRLLLGAVDSLLRSEDPNEPTASIQYDDLQIEHIMPQSWEANWPLLDDAGEPIPESLPLAETGEAAATNPEWIALARDRRRAIDRIGNLTLVTGTFNGAVLSNLGWAEKKPAFGQQKSLVINYPISRTDAWDEKAIDERSAVLTDVVVRIWPSPTALESSTES